MRAARLLCALGGVVACQPDLGEPASLVQSPRILAVRSQPAEAAPGAAVDLQLLLGSAEGAVTATDVEWAFCLIPKPPVDNSVVSAACLGDAGQAIAGRAAQVSAVVPTAACALFGPQLPPTPAGQPPARPRDADGTGGYFQPVRVRPVAWPGCGGAGPLGFGLTRIWCGLAGASAQTAAAYRDRYRINRNPQLVALRVTDDDQELPVSALPMGRALQLHATWTQDSAEQFVALDPGSQLLQDRTESLQLAWFANAGRFAYPHTAAGRGESASTNEWTAPLTPGPVAVWLVLRDDRGGVDWLTSTLTVR